MIRKLDVPMELGEGVEVRVLAWHKQEGDAIAEGEALVEWETDKAIVLVTAKQGGFLRKLFAREGDWLKVGEVSAFFADSLDEPVPDDRGAAAQGLIANFETT
ncbi:MAG: lipoyl domain-containing protein [Deltaproteobacteria bacterium]|nr:lipoyl domain-containing protein [Deltaproteobacteria bacterium]